MKIGDRVQSIHLHRQHDMRIGYITATETYRSFGRVAEYVYVRWISPCGEIEKEPMRLETWEITPAESARAGGGA